MEAKSINHKLSPATRAGLFTTLMAQAKPGAKVSNVETRTVYLCPKCEDEHNSEQSAIDCCPPGIDTATRYVCPVCDEGHEVEDDAMTCCGCPGSAAPVRCPVCNGEAEDHEDAADCCLWKDLGPFERQRIARAVEAGAEWADAIAAEAA